MICNSKVTVYHKGLDETTKLETWTRFNYDNVWFFGGENAGINKGYDNANNFDCRIPYDTNNVDFNNFAKGDIVVQGSLDKNIETAQELSEYLTYVIVSLNNNNFGNNKHIHIGGK